MESREKNELPHSINDTTLADEFGESYCYGAGDKNWQRESGSNDTIENAETTMKNAQDLHNKSHFVWYGSNSGFPGESTDTSRKCATRKVIFIAVSISLILVGLTIGLSVYYLT